MKVNLEELLDYMDMPDIKIEPPPGIDTERIHQCVMEQVQNTPSAVKRDHPKTHHRLRVLMIAIAATLILSVTASAVYYLTHTREAALMEAGPLDGGLFSTTLDDRSKEVVDNSAVDYAMIQTSNGTTVTLDSIMGFHSTDYSVAYVTVSIALPSGINTEVDVEACGFQWMELQPSASEQLLAGDAAQVAVQTDENTVSVMFAFSFRYHDVTDIPVTLTLENFNTGSQEISGTWVFEIDALVLSSLNTISFDQDCFAEMPFEISDIQLSNFGGTITMQGYQELAAYHFQKIVREQYGDLNLPWDKLKPDYSALKALYDSEDLTEPQYQKLLGLLNDDSIWRLNIWVEYADGRTYSESKDFGILFDEQIAAQRRLTAVQNGEITEEEADKLAAQETNNENSGIIPFAFLAPQDISSAEYLVIEGVKIPLHNE